MKNNYLSPEIIFSILLIVITFCFFQPLQQMWMPTMVHNFLLLGFAVIFSLFALFVWREKSRDEREEQHRQVAGRIGFLIGAGLLVAGIIIQSLHHSLDTWLLITLAGMIIGKLVGRWYSELRH